MEPTLPLSSALKLYRPRRRFPPKLALCTWKALSTFLRADTGRDTPLVSIQTAGEFLNWHPHLHVLTAAGAFRKDGSFVPSPFFDTGTLRELFQVLVLPGRAPPLFPEFSPDPFPVYVHSRRDEGQTIQGQALRRHAGRARGIRGCRRS